MENAELDIVRKLHIIFKAKSLILSIAESCTAGYISHLITSLPGASDFYESSMILYTPNAKNRLLGIKKSFLKKHGTVSEETAREMAEAMMSRSKSDFALAVTGNLGPEPIENKKVGLVYIAVSSSRLTESKGMIFDGTRDEIKKATSIAALTFLFEVVSAWT